MIKYIIQEIVVWSHLVSPGDSHTKALPFKLYLGLEDVTEVDNDPKGRLVSFRVALSNERVLCVYAPSGDSTREQLARGRFFEELQNCMEDKNKGNEKKIILKEFNCNMDKMERDAGNKCIIII